MSIKTPYLVFIGNCKAQHNIAIAQSFVDIHPEYCIGEYALPSCSVSVNLPRITIWQAAERGVKSFIVGTDDNVVLQDNDVLSSIVEALDAGLDIVSSFPEQLRSIDLIREKVNQSGHKLLDTAELFITQTSSFSATLSMASAS